MRTLLIVALSTVLPLHAFGLSIVFHEDSPEALNFEMANLGPSPGDQSIVSPSGSWYLYAFVYQFDPGDKFAEVGAYVKKLLPVEEFIGVDLIFPQTYDPGDFPLHTTGVNEFGDEYIGAFELLPGSEADAQAWDWVMTLRTAEGIRAPDTGGAGALLAILLPLLVRRALAQRQAPLR